jgi:hypothetical protein
MGSVSISGERERAVLRKVSEAQGMEWSLLSAVILDFSRHTWNTWKGLEQPCGLSRGVVDVKCCKQNQPLMEICSYLIAFSM